MSRTGSPRGALVAIATVVGLAVGCVQCGERGGPGVPGMVRVEGGRLSWAMEGPDPGGHGPPSGTEVPSLWVDRFEVTVARYLEFCVATGRRSKCRNEADGDDFPAIVPHGEAEAFAEFMGARLPTRAEMLWLLSSRGEHRTYPWGEGAIPEGFGNVGGEEWSGRAEESRRPGHVAGYSDAHVGLAPVGSYRPDALGIFDLGGNAAEWCCESGVVPTVQVDGFGTGYGIGWFVAGGDHRSDLSRLRCDYSVLMRGDTGYPVGFRCVRPVGSE